MKIKLEEINTLFDYMDNKSQDEFMAQIEEDEQYSVMINDLMLDYKHMIAERLESAINCGFDEEILTDDLGYSKEEIEILKNYQTYELEVDL